MTSRIGKGPWARAFGAALVPDESTAEAQRGKQLAAEGAVQDLKIEVGLITARVEGCNVTLSTPRVPARIWTAMTNYARNRGALERAIRGETQSVHLEHLMGEDWGEPLVPGSLAVVRACTCRESGICDHIATLAYVVADEIDATPAVLLTWRGCTSGSGAGESATSVGRLDQVLRAVDPWVGGSLPSVLSARSRPTESVLKRLGVTGIRVADEDLSDTLRGAYAALARESRESNHSG